MLKILKSLMVTVMLLVSVTVTAFDIRGMHIDLRTEVMTMDALKKLADKAAAGGINAIVMEWEATFPFVENATICNDEAYTREEVRDFIDYCGKLGIDVIPLQNCFGHSEYILRHDRYGALRESVKDFSQVCPCQEKLAKEVFRSIFREIVEMHPSQYIHIGADETRLLGTCKRCAAKVEKVGKSHLFCDYIVAMCDVVREFGKTPIIWADILTKYPEAASKLPKDLILLDWNYGWNINKFGDFRKIASSGFPMWGAPALRSGPDDLHLTQWMKHFNNLRDYVSFVRDLGFKGIIETSWSTSGQYGYIYSGQWQAWEIQPMRQVYPLAGFDILQQAFCEASSSDKPFEPEGFIRRYCADKFGFDAAAQETMLDYFNLPQSVITAKNKKVLNEELKASEALQKRMNALRPRSGKTEFAHFKLMLDIRVNYLKFRQIESVYESAAFNPSKKAGLAAELKPVLNECKALQKRYCSLNKGYLKHPERSFGSWNYLGHMENIYAVLTTK
jgi:hypothetical protein